MLLVEKERIHYSDVLTFLFRRGWREAYQLCLVTSKVYWRTDCRGTTSLWTWALSSTARLSIYSNTRFSLPISQFTYSTWPFSSTVSAAAAI